MIISATLFSEPTLASSRQSESFLIQAVSTVSSSTVPFSLKENYFRKLDCDGFFKKAASIRFGYFLMRAWLAGIMLAIFGLWLATI